jgi:hypothetical protein
MMDEIIEVITYSGYRGEEVPRAFSSTRRESKLRKSWTRGLKKTLPAKFEEDISRLKETTGILIRYTIMRRSWHGSMYKKRKSKDRRDFITALVSF